MASDPLTFGSFFGVKIEEKTNIVRRKETRTSDFCILLKSRKFTSFFGGFCSCFGEKVLLIELKIFFCCVKRKKQRYFRKLTKRWPFYINPQPFELERIFRIKRKWSTRTNSLLAKVLTVASSFFVPFVPVLQGFTEVFSPNRESLKLTWQRVFWIKSLLFLCFYRTWVLTIFKSIKC